MDQSRTFLAIALCFGILIAWQKFYVEPRTPLQQNSVQQQAISTPGETRGFNPVEGTGQPAIPAPATPPRPARTLGVWTRTGEAKIGDGGRFFVDWTLKSYQKGLQANTAAIDLNSVTNISVGQTELSFDDPAFAYLSRAQGTLVPSPQGVAWIYEDPNVRLERIFTGTAEQPYLNVKVRMDFKTRHPNYAYVSVSSEAAANDPEANDRQLVYYSNDSIDRIGTKGAVKLKEVATPVRYIGAGDRYFLMALVNNGLVEPKGLVQPLPTGGGRISMAYPIQSASTSLSFKAFFGPKDLQLLKSVDPALDDTVNFGWFTVFAYPLLKILQWLDQFVKNYGIAIILLTVMLKLALYPLTYKSMKSMKQMAKLQPQLQRIREQYKDDKEALNRETLAMMRTHGYNPVAGCLPMVIQMPIFFALYRVLYNSIELYHAPLGGWIQDLSAKDPYYITPVILAITMFVQQKLSPNAATDPSQQRMLQFMPLIFGFMMMNLPAGLTLYMLANAIMSIIQQLILNKKLNIHPHAPDASVVAEGAR